MSVGLYDMDYMTYFKVPLNLELMKLSTYYKKRGEIVKLSPKLDPEKYSKFIMRQDYENGVYSRKIFQYPNMEYGGLAFSSNKYIPLPLDIEMQPADTSLYRNAADRSEKLKKGDVHTFPFYLPQLNMTHLRLSLDGENIWKDYQKQIPILEKGQTFIFHDYDLTKIKGARDLIKELKNKAHAPGFKSYGHAGIKFPLRLIQSADLSKWAGVFDVAELSPIEFTGIANDEDFIYFLENTPAKDRCIQFEYYVGDLEQNEKRCIDKLPDVYRQMLFAKSKGKKFQLKYDPKTFKDKRWERVIVLMGCLMSLKLSCSMYNLAKGLEDTRIVQANEGMVTQGEARNLFAFTREVHPELFRMFYEVNDIRVEGGKIYNDWH